MNAATPGLRIGPCRRRRRAAPPPLAGLLLCAAALALPGCQSSYLASQLAGQAHLLAAARPVDEVLADPSTSPALAGRLREAKELLAFAREQGLDVGDAYRTWVVPPGGAPVWVVSACPPDRLEPLQWSFPLVGAFPYKGFFRRELAEAQARKLRADGLEVDLRPAVAYSTLGWLPDPLLPTLLDGDAGDRAAGILHELAHRSVFVPGDARLNESVAVSIEERGVALWLAERGDAAAAEEHARRCRDRERLRAEIARTIDELRRAFESPDRERRLAARAERLGELRERLAATPFESQRYRAAARIEWTLPALLLQDVYGGDAPLLDGVWRTAGGSLPGYLDALRRASEGEEPRRELERISTGDLPGEAGPGHGSDSLSGIGPAQIAAFPGNAPPPATVGGGDPEAGG